MDMPANSIFSGPITHQLSMLFMKIFLHASVEKKKEVEKKKKKREEKTGLRVLNTFTSCFQVTLWQ